jgi:hypothetical protein
VELLRREEKTTSDEQLCGFFYASKLEASIFPFFWKYGSYLTTLT